MSRVDEAVSLFRSGCACSQAILVACSESQGVDRQTSLKIAAGFAGGMRMGNTCGAASGAIMVLERFPIISSGSDSMVLQQRRTMAPSAHA